MKFDVVKRGYCAISIENRRREGGCKGVRDKFGGKMARFEETGSQCNGKETTQKEKMEVGAKDVVE